MVNRTRIAVAAALSLTFYGAATAQSLVPRPESLPALKISAPENGNWLAQASNSSTEPSSYWRLTTAAILAGASVQDVSSYSVKSGEIKGQKAVRGGSGNRTSNPSLYGMQGAGAGGAATPMITSVVGQFGYGSSDFGNVMTFAGGLQVLFPRTEKLAFYGQALVGAMKFEGDSDLLIQPTGGVLVPIADGKYAVNAEVGVGILKFEGGSETGLRVAGGLLIPLGR